MVVFQQITSLQTELNYLKGVWVSQQITNFQTELNYLDKFKIYLILHKSAIWDRTPPTYTSNAVYMCAAGIKGPKSLNRIELSQFVQKLLHF